MVVLVNTSLSSRLRQGYIFTKTITLPLNTFKGYFFLAIKIGGM